jgi:hypothetical protein
LGSTSAVAEVLDVKYVGTVASVVILVPSLLPGLIHQGPRARMCRTAPAISMVQAMHQAPVFRLAPITAIHHGPRARLLRPLRPLFKLDLHFSMTTQCFVIFSFARFRLHSLYPCRLLKIFPSYFFRNPIFLQPQA